MSYIDNMIKRDNETRYSKADKLEKLIAEKNPYQGDTVENRIKHNAYSEGFEDAFKEFYRQLTTNIKPLPPEFNKFIDDNFWNLI